MTCSGAGARGHPLGTEVLQSLGESVGRVQSIRKHTETYCEEDKGKADRAMKNAHSQAQVPSESER